MAKKQKKIKSKRVPTKRQLSRWQREARIRRVIIIVAAVFLASIIGYVSYAHYDSQIRPLRETVIEVNNTSFSMGYYVDMLDAYTRGQDPTYVYNMTGQVVTDIEYGELIRQGANGLGIKLTNQEIDNGIKDNALPNKKVYRDMVGASLLEDKLQTYFKAQLPDKMEQAHSQVTLLESQEVADNVMSEIENGGNFTALVEEFSYHSQSKGNGGDLGWLPKELVPEAIADTFQLLPGEVSQPIYDGAAVKAVGYWLIEVTEKDETKGINASTMLLGSEQEANEVKNELASKNFTTMAQEYSQHESKDNGGELGWIKPGDIGSDAFDEVAFNLTLNEVSAPVKDETVQTEGGYWIVKILEKGDHGLSDDVKNQLASKRFVDWFQEQLTEGVVVNNLDENKIFWAIQKVLQGR